jgi:hypothetical protein
VNFDVGHVNDNQCNVSQGKALPHYAITIATALLVSHPDVSTKFLNLAPQHEGVLGSGIIAPYIMMKM